MNDRLQSAELDAQANPSSLSHLECVSAARDSLRRHQHIKTIGASVRSRQQWLKYGDKGSKFFFNYLKQKQSKEKIDRIVIDNQELTDINDIAAAFEEFYKALFNSEDSSNAKDLRNKCKELIPKKIVEGHVSILRARISIQEISDAISALKKDKAPGPDGLPAEFYKSNIDWITKDLFDLYSEAYDRGTLGNSINMGIIKLIPKDGDKSLIKNWRPITLLNVSYKILAKALASRLVNILPNFICSTQTGFIKGRYILENLVTSWESMEWAKSSNQNSAMFLLDFEKAYDRIEWDFILSILQAFGFPDEFVRYIQVLLKDSSARIEINGFLSNPIPLSRSIRQGCPLAPALFVIASDALYYILRDDTISPKVNGISLPDNSELLNIQFADDTSLFLELSCLNIQLLNLKLELFETISGARISKSKSIMLGWKEEPPDWFLQFGYSWGGPHKIVRYLGVPFSISPSLKDMWIWVKDKIIKKLYKWDNRVLSLAGRVQVCQKILSSYSIYYSSVWMFSNYQLFEIQKAIRRFLWSDGKGNRKKHAVRWSWCHIDKKLGGLGLKDLRIQGVSLAAKWIFQALDGHEPWKILLRNNIQSGFPKQAKYWKNLPFADLVAGTFPVSVQGSMVFKSIWKAWELVRGFIYNSNFDSNNSIHGERSIWWNLQHNGKPLALTQGCSAKHWNNLGIKSFIDILENDNLASWQDIRLKFNLPDSHKRTYNMIVNACHPLNLPRRCDVDSHRFLYFRWDDGSLLHKIKAKDIYKVLNKDHSILSHLNTTWYMNLDSLEWHKILDKFWKSHIPPKILHFKWQLLLDRLPVKNQAGDTDSCSICRVPENLRHIFFTCHFARIIWNFFGISITDHVSVLDTILGNISGLKKDANFFWNILSSHILWFIWKSRNEDKFQDVGRSLTLFQLKLIRFKIISQVCCIMKLEKDKLERFLRDGHATMFIYEMKHGLERASIIDDRAAFEEALKRLIKEMRDTRGPFSDRLEFFAHILERKKVVWMEGELGWTAWIDDRDDILD